MVDYLRLGGFAVRDGVTWASMVYEPCEVRFPSRLTRLLALEKINLSFFSCGAVGNKCAVDVALEREKWEKAAALITDNFNVFTIHTEKRSVVASVFPHGRNPLIAAKVFRSIHEAGIDRYAAAQSNSALSVLIGEEKLQAFAEALFVYFRFRAYPTVADWESRRAPVTVPREIVASYQEKRPKVYSLDWHEGFHFFRVANGRETNGSAAEALEHLAAIGEYTGYLGVCGPPPAAITLAAASPATGLGPVLESRYPVGVFTMNGPHFGDRYGIAAELMNALERQGIEVLAVACNMASITGVILNDDVHQAIDAITSCFDVPLVTRTSGQS
jgi:aspartokinase